MYSYTLISLPVTPHKAIGDFATVLNIDLQNGYPVTVRLLRNGNTESPEKAPVKSHIINSTNRLSFFGQSRTTRPNMAIGTGPLRIPRN